MPLSAEGKIIKVGNSSGLILPKILFDNYKIEQGDMLKIVMTESGLFIPAKQNESAFVKKALVKSLKALGGNKN